MVNYFQIFPPLVFSYRLFIFTNRWNFQARTWVWRKCAAENRVKEGIEQESNGAANQEKQIFLLCQISPSASSTRDLGTRLNYALFNMPFAAKFLHLASRESVGGPYEIWSFLTWRSCLQASRYPLMRVKDSPPLQAIFNANPSMRALAKNIASTSKRTLI